jgi:hypothetical protein
MEEPIHAASTVIVIFVASGVRDGLRVSKKDTGEVMP